MLECPYSLKAIREHLKSRCHWMTHHMILCPIMQMMWKALNGMGVGHIIPPFDELARRSCQRDDTF